MMSKMRELSKVFIVIVALSFIGLMVFEWGMDYTGRGQRQNVVGKVNGKELTYEMFSEMYQNLYQTEKSRTQADLTESQLVELRNTVWERFVQRILLEEEMERLNITVSDSEIVYQIKHYPMPEIRNNPGFQTDGQFDWNKYYSSFTNPDIPWYQIEEYYRQQVLPFQKLQNIITSTVRVSESEVLQEFIDSNQKVKVAFLEIPFSKFTDVGLDVSDEDAKTYYNDNLADFQQPESRQLSYVEFPLTPTVKDTQRIYSEFNDIKQRLINGEDFNELAEIYSEDPAVKTNNGRYDYFERGAMVKSFEDAAFTGKIGSLVGPVQTQFGLHLIKIEDRRLQNGKDQAKVSHILLKFAPGPSTRETQSSAAAFFAEDSRLDGFQTIATKQNLPIKQTSYLTEENQFVPGIGRNVQIHDFAFRSNLNAISDIIETESAFMVFELTDIKEAGPRPFEEVKNVIISRIQSDKRKDEARNFAASIREKIENKISFGKIAADDASGKVRFDSTSEFTIKGSPQGIGFDLKFNAQAFSLAKGQVSEEIETIRGLYWQELLGKSAVDTTVYQVQKEMLRQRLYTNKRNQVFTNWFEYLKANADIEDNRKLFNL
ncbi:MAG: hypothetical protein E4H13_00110 [Calditrichales bacterium]|nr:MAG: hypothetical protein E4H13_00110 [Calditrichales bacterium]